MRTFFVSMFVAFSLMFATVTFGSDIPFVEVALSDGSIITVPESTSAGDALSLSFAAIKGMKGSTPIMISILVLMILVSFAKSDLVGNWFGKQSAIIKRVIIVLLGQILGVLSLIDQGIVWYTSLWLGLVVSGGAMLTFELFGSLFPKGASVFNMLAKLLSVFKKA